MIKINLLHGITRAAGGTQAGGDESIEVSDTLVKAGLARIGVILIAPALFFVWEKINISNKQSEIASKRSQIESIRSENQKSANLTAEIEKFIQEKKGLENQIKIIDQLNRGRQRVVQILETIGRLMPQKAWVTQLKFESDRLIVNGNAWSNQEISEFTSRMEKSVYFRGVDLKNVDEAAFRGGTVKSFVIETGLEGE